MALLHICISCGKTTSLTFLSIVCIRPVGLYVIMYRSVLLGVCSCTSLYVYNNMPCLISKTDLICLSCWVQVWLIVLKFCPSWKQIHTNITRGKKIYKLQSMISFYLLFSSGQNEVKMLRAQNCAWSNFSIETQTLEKKCTYYWFWIDFLCSKMHIRTSWFEGYLMFL